MLKKCNRRLNIRKKTLNQQLTIIVKILTALIVLGLTMWGVTKIKEVESLKTKVEWKIDNNLPIRKSILEKKIQHLVENKYLLDLIKIKQTLKNEPWIAEVQVKRTFFNAIQISVVAQKIAMRWENTECKAKNSPQCFGYISTDGALFIPKKIVESNTLLARSKSEQTTVTKFYRDYQTYREIANNKAIKVFSRTHIDKLIFHPNIKVILGNQQQQKRLQRFLQAYKKLRETVAKAKLNQTTFDMRYPKAFTLKP